MPSSMIWRLMLTMCAWRILRRFTTSVICMRDLQFVALRLHGEDADLAGLHVVADLARHVGQRTRRQVFQHERVEGQRPDFQFVRRVLAAISATGSIGDQRDFLVGLDAQAARSPRCARPA